MSILVATEGTRVPSRTVEEAYELARLCGEELVVLHVMDQDLFDERRGDTTWKDTTPYLPAGVSYGEAASQPDDRGSGSTSDYDVTHAQDDAMGLARDVVDQTLEESENVTYQGRVGEPVKEILDEADRRDTRYLVIGGRKRSAVGKAVFGSITQSILLTADLPVMTVMRDE